MRVIDIENITEAMRDDTRFVLRCEEVFHDKISAAAASILMNKSKKPLVCLTGPSGSGKTTTAMRLKAYLENLGVKVCLLSMDNFFLPLADRPPELTDWESPLCVNRDLLIDCIHRLSDGEEVELPIYDFKSGTTGSWVKMQGDRDAIIIAEGIHMLNPLIFDRVRDMATGVYVAPRTRIITTHAWTAASGTISCPISPTRASTSTPSTTTSRASSRAISRRSPSSTPSLTTPSSTSTG